MYVFLTGATGFIGTAIIPELIRSGHRVLGLARSDAGAATLKASGAAVHHGTLEDLDSLRRGAAQADAVIHCAYDHDFSRFAENCIKEGHVVEALGSALAGTDRPLVITSVTGMGTPAPGRIAVEDHYDADHPNPRKSTENAGAALTARGINVSVVRLSQIHDPVRQGFVSQLIRIAREKGISAYVGEGANRWPAAHIGDVARLYRMALEKHATGSRYHAVGEEGIALRNLAAVIAQGLDIPAVSLSVEEAKAHFGWLFPFAAGDIPASSALTQQRLDWHPTGPGMLSDLEKMAWVGM